MNLFCTLVLMNLFCFAGMFLFLLKKKREIPQECVVWQLPVIFYLDERLLHYTINHIAQAKTDTLGYNHTLLFFYFVDLQNRFQV